MATQPGNVSPAIQQKIEELVRLYFDEGPVEIEEFIELVNKSTQLLSGNYAMVSVRIVDGRPKGQKQMARPSLSNVETCICCGRPK